MKIQELNIGIHLPEELQYLLSMSYNVWWSFNDNAQNLYKMINPELWEKSNHNPFEVLINLTHEDMDELKKDAVFMSRLHDVWTDYINYIKNPKWFELYHAKENSDMLVAYFSAEYGLHESIQIYSGGLGILSGDHCKAASDLGLPFVGVGLLYRNGYFHQYLNTDGWQQEYSPYQEFFKLPIEPAKDENNEPVMISVESPNRTVYAKVWEMHVGFIKLILLDTDIDENHPEDRDITSQLYGGDNVMRIRQEVMLGVGGQRALDALDIRPTVYHLNEGHPAFLTLERLKKLTVDEGLEMLTAMEVVQKSTLFTTHTPVPAGFDIFDKSLIKQYISVIYEQHHITTEDIMRLGRVHPNDQSEPFSMAILGMKMSTFRNGVSALHGDVSRDMFKSLWPKALKSCIPIEHVTNGVHLPTWISEDMKKLYHRYLGENWILKPYDFSVWEMADSIPDLELMKTKQQLRARLIGYTRKKLKEQIQSRNGAYSELRKVDTVLNPDALTIGFARRFATYKRGYMIFMDEDRLSKILNHPEHPVQIIIAGKAHPKDSEGKEIIKKIVHIARKPEFRDRIVFLEDYDINMARHLAAGVDVWLNNPKRPMEASGTSGMKISANGGLNFSIPDGWWAEGYNGKNGWSIGFGEEYDDDGYQNFVESQELYDKLENEIVPMFYSYDKSGLPREWIYMMKDTIRSIPSFFNTTRMVMEYTTQYYLKLHQLYEEITSDNYKGVTEFLTWKQHLASKWSQVRFNDADLGGENPIIGDQLKMTANVYLGGLEPENVHVYAVMEYNTEGAEFTEPDFVLLNSTTVEDDNALFEADYTLSSSGKLRAGFVVLPAHRFVQRDFEANLAVWY